MRAVLALCTWREPSRWVRKLGQPMPLLAKLAIARLDQVINCAVVVLEMRNSTLNHVSPYILKSSPGFYA